MFLPALAFTFSIFALIATFKMDNLTQGLLFLLMISSVVGLIYLFVLFPGLSGFAVALGLGAFIFRQNRK